MMIFNSAANNIATTKETIICLSINSINIFNLRSYYTQISTKTVLEFSLC